MTTEIHTLPQKAVEQDHRLEASASNSNEALAKHRWHWTLDESNPERVGVNDYARSVGRDKRRIARVTTGYAAWLAAGEDASVLADYIERAGVSAEKEVAVEAVAQARGMTFASARNTSKRREEARVIQQAARERAAEKGTDYADEARSLARSFVQQEQAQQKQEVERKSRHGVRYLRTESLIDKARRLLNDAAVEMADVAFDKEEVEFLTDALNKVSRVVALMDNRLAGRSAPIDWDATLASIMKEAN